METTTTQEIIKQQNEIIEHYKILDENHQKTMEMFHRILVSLSELLASGQDEGRQIALKHINKFIQILDK